MDHPATRHVSPGQSHLPQSWDCGAISQDSGSPGEPSQPVASGRVLSAPRAVPQELKVAHPLGGSRMVVPRSFQFLDQGSSLLPAGLPLPPPHPRSQLRDSAPGAAVEPACQSPETIMAGSAPAFSALHAKSRGSAHMAMHNLQHNLLPAYIADSIQSFIMYIY